MHMSSMNKRNINHTKFLLIIAMRRSLIYKLLTLKIDIYKIKY